MNCVMNNTGIKGTLPLTRNTRAQCEIFYSYRRKQSDTIVGHYVKQLGKAPPVDFTKKISVTVKLNLSLLTICLVKSKNNTQIILRTCYFKK